MLLRDGFIQIENQGIKYNDSLTRILEMTITMKKTIDNINNYQHLFFENCLFFTLRGNLRLIFNSEGKFISVCFGYGKYSCDENDLNSLKTFLKQQKCKNGKLYEWGTVGVYEDPHTRTSNIVINWK